MNNVVIGDLGKLRGASSYRYDGVLGQDSTFSSTGELSNFRLTVCASTFSNLGIFTGSLANSTFNIVAFFPVSLRVRFLDGSQVDFGFPYELDTLYNMVITYDGTTVTLDVDSGVYTESIVLAGKTISFDSFGGGYDGSQFPFYGEICSYKLESFDRSTIYCEYDIANSFGKTTLADLSGSGRTCSVNGGISWKKGIDENFLTPTAYKSSWTIPMEESQNVVYTDATPFYATDNVFWNDYNIDPTYDFTVTQQISDTGYGYGFNTYNYNYSY